MVAPNTGQVAPRAPRCRVAEIFRRHGHAYREAHLLPPQEARVLAALSSCRTAQLGGHIEYCPECGYSHPFYNACRDRHCPSCQAYAQGDWIAEREERALPVGHFHVVFTLPAELRRLVRADPRRVYDIVFAAASETLMTLGRNELGAELGLMIVLHTWSRELLLHPHVHCIVTGGGLASDGRWVPSPDFLFDHKVMAKLFRGIVRSRLLAAFEAKKLRVPDDLRTGRAFRRHLRDTYRHAWVVHCEAPLGGAQHVIRYLGRYVHRVGLSDERLVAVTEDAVTFRTRGADQLTLPAHEFIRRFLLHVLPPNFHKIRHFGLYSSSHVHRRLAAARALLSNPPPAPSPTTEEPPAPPEPRRCPRCGTPLVSVHLLFADLVGVVLTWPTGREPPDTS